jgi:catechol 2,3-dioxygenase-like lactoylglutathione lyase family enzyme
MMPRSHILVAVVPCNDLDASQAFYTRLGFAEGERKDDEYRILSDGKGGELHLTRAPEGWVVPGRNPLPFIFTQRTSMDWRRLSGVRPKISLGACTNLVSPIQTKRWFGLAGRRGCASRVSRSLSVVSQ